MIADVEQYPHVRNSKVCLCCGNAKAMGLLVCWPCHNTLKVVHDGGYGPDVERMLAKAETLFVKRANERFPITKS